MDNDERKLSVEEYRTLGTLLGVLRDAAKITAGYNKSHGLEERDEEKYKRAGEDSKSLIDFCDALGTGVGFSLLLHSDSHHFNKRKSAELRPEAIAEAPSSRLEEASAKPAKEKPKGLQQQ